MVYKRLSEVLSIEEVKELGSRVCIVSGVGSGKNHWVENELTKHGNVLLITSRKAVKDQTLSREFFTEKSEWYGKNFKVCTHSKIGKFVKSNIRPNESIDETIFDYVVVDEAHSIVSDSTFSDDTNYLWQFITNVKATVILMTATYEIIKEMIEQEGFAIIDKTEECINIRPSNINLITDKEAGELLLTASSNNKIIYMMPSATEAYRIENELIKHYLRDDVVAITSSERDNSFNIKERKDREDATYKHIVSQMRLPDDVNIILTTTKFREGVNIKDDTINQCIVGCHSHIDIRQFAGRVRTGIETLHIIENKKQHNDKFFTFAIDMAKRLIPKFDEVIYEYLHMGFGARKTPYARIENCVKFYSEIEKKFELIKFNRYKNKFELFQQRIIAHERERQDKEDFKVNTWLYLGKLFGKGINISLNTKESYKQGIRDRCTLFLQDYVGRPLLPSEIDKLLSDLTECGLRASKDKEYKNLASAVSPLGYKLERAGNHNKGTKKIVPKVE